MNRIKIFSGDTSKKLQKKINRWRKKMKRKRPVGFKIGSVSLSAADPVGHNIHVAVTYKT